MYKALSLYLFTLQLQTNVKTIMAEAIKTNTINHHVLHSLLIIIVELEIFFSDSPSTSKLLLSAIRHFARITLFIETRSSTEHVFRELAYRER